MQILVNPTFRELLKLAPPSSAGARVVVMGKNIGVAPALGHIHKDIVDVMRNNRLPVAEPYLELFVDAMCGDYRVTCTSSLPDGVVSWREVVVKNHEQLLDDLCKIFGDSEEC